jgi:nucleoid-associated protein YgaU
MTEPLNVTADELEKLSNLYKIQALMIQLGKNLSLISTGSNGKKIIVNGGSLYQLASQYYGDATMWTNIAKANGLVDPKLPDGITLTLFIPITTSNNEGIYEP